ncbi:MAG TPA: hypothetical protein PKU80_02255 [Candidatus Limiplasma sp.]|nr:hypothetical protein [Candidatus Limiplasma sp.]HRX07643.1 hypothetical protein [Candidatus Limiplasma sp.]
MKPLRNGRMLMIELMIIILFFSLSSVTVVRLFAAASQLSRQSTVSTTLLQTAQSWADLLQAEDDFQAFLQKNGWDEEGDAMSLSVDGGLLKLTGLTIQNGTGGRLIACTLAAFVDEQEMFTLPIVRYAPEDLP